MAIKVPTVYPSSYNHCSFLQRLFEFSHKKRKKNMQLKPSPNAANFLHILYNKLVRLSLKEKGKTRSGTSNTEGCSFYHKY
jgi:hypothetical protein